MKYFVNIRLNHYSCSLLLLLFFFKVKTFIKFLVGVRKKNIQASLHSHEVYDKVANILATLLRLLY